MLILLLLVFTTQASAYTTIEKVSRFPEMTQYAMAAYCPRIYSDNKFNCGLNCQGAINSTKVFKSVLNNKTHGAVFIATNSETKDIVVSFRGTVRRNYLTELSTRLVDANFLKGDGLKIDQAFKKIYLSIREETQSNIRGVALANPFYRIIFVGHSLGAALSQIAAIDYLQSSNQADRIMVYAVSSPRVGNSEFARLLNTRLNSKILRFGNRGDPIVQLPLAFFGYEHALQQYTIESNGTVTECKNNFGSGESKECSEDIFSETLSIKRIAHIHVLGFNSQC